MSKVNFDETIGILEELIKVESPYFQEAELVERVSEWLRQNGIENEIQDYHEKKVTGFKGKNVISVLEGGAEGPTVYFNGHLDTVKLCNGWERPPFEATIEDGRLYGLGALDMKGGCAAIMAAVKAFKSNHPKFKGKIITSLVSGEEGPYGLGTDAIINAGITDHVDVSIVTEPSAGFTKSDFPCICLGARGGYGVTVEFFGKAAHAANPEEGLSAAVDAAKMISNLDQIQFKEDKYLGKGCICVVAMESDGGTCSVPDYAKVQLLRHTVPGETKDTVSAELEAVMKGAGVDCEYKISYRPAPSKDAEAFLPYTVEEESPFVGSLKESCKNVTGRDASIAYFQSIGDFNYLGTRVDAPCIIFGPQGENYHSHDEYTTLESLTETAAILYDYLEGLLLS